MNATLTLNVPVFLHDCYPGWTTARDRLGLPRVRDVRRDLRQPYDPPVRRLDLRARSRRCRATALPARPCPTSGTSGPRPMTSPRT
jgi:hypothetical protein